MNKKMVSLFTLIVFTVLTFSCYSIKKEKIKTIASWKEKDIFAVLKTSGERIEFSKINRGRIEGDKIVGVVVEEGEIETISIPLSEVKMVWIKKFDDFKAFLLTITGLISIPIIAFGIYIFTVMLTKKL